MTLRAGCDAASRGLPNPSYTPASYDTSVDVVVWTSRVVGVDFSQCHTASDRISKFSINNGESANCSALRKYTHNQVINVV
jgi:hypothetical protein